MLSTSQEACVSAGHAGAGGTAGGLVVVVDTEARLHHHIAIVVLVLAVFIYGAREQKRLLSPRGSQDQWEEKRKSEGTQSFLWVPCVCGSLSEHTQRPE